MSYFAHQAGIQPRVTREMSCELSRRDSLVIMKLLLLFLWELGVRSRTFVCSCSSKERLARDVETLYRELLTGGLALCH